MSDMGLSRRKFTGRLLALPSALLLARGLAGCSPGYASEGIVVPDLEDGFIVFNSGGNSGGATPGNAWLTTIESALQRRGNGDPQMAFLGKECRAESVGQGAFDDRGNYEFVGLKGFDGNYIIRHGADLLEEHEFQRVTDDAVQLGFDFDVRSAQRVAHKVEFGEVLTMLQGWTERAVRRLFVQITYQHGGETFSLFTRCRYINFPHRASSGESYLQPISGRVLVWDGGRLHLAYVVIHVRNGLVQGLQFKVLARANFGVDLAISDFVRTLVVDAGTASADFYYYA